MTSARPAPWFALLSTVASLVAVPTVVWFNETAAVWTERAPGAALAAGLVLLSLYLWTRVLRSDDAIVPGPERPGTRRPRMQEHRL